MKTWNDPGGSPRRLVSVAGAALILAGGVAVLRAFNPQPDPPKVFGILRRTNIYAGAQPWISATAATVSSPQ